LHDVHLQHKDAIAGLDLIIAGLYLLGVEVVQLYRLLEGKEMSGAVVAFQRCGDLFFTLGATWMTILSQWLEGLFAPEDCVDDGQASQSSDVGYNFGELEIHLLQGFLHVLDVPRPITDQHFPLMHQSA